MKNAIAFLLLILPLALLAQEPEKLWDSIRDSQYEWECQEQNGDFISGHVRQDKAVAACSNRTLADGVQRSVVSGSYRIIRLKDPATTPPTETPPVEPPIEPPVDPPPGEQPLVTFGPITATVQYPGAISALKQDAFRWELTFTLNSLGNSINGLVAKDESGQTDAGHLSVWMNGSRIRVRHQDIAGGHANVVLDSITQVVVGQEYQVTVSVEAGAGIGLFVDGVLEASDPWAVGIAGNDLPLTLGGYCAICTDVVGPSRPIDGTIYMEIFNEPVAFTPPQPVSAELKWSIPTERMDGQPLTVGELVSINAYQVSPGNRTLIAKVDPDVSGYEVTGLTAGGEYCFVVTAVDNGNRESIDSNVACKTP